MPEPSPKNKNKGPRGSKKSINNSSEKRKSSMNSKIKSKPSMSIEI